MEAIGTQLANEWFDWFMALDYFPENEETMKKTFEILIDILNNGDWEKVSEDVVVDLNYDPEIKGWVIENQDELLENFFG